MIVVMGFHHCGDGGETAGLQTVSVRRINEVIRMVEWLACLLTILRFESAHWSIPPHLEHATL